MKPSPPTERERIAVAKLKAQLHAEAQAIEQLPRAERRAAHRHSLAYRIARRATRRRVFGGWAGAFRPHHPSVRP